MEKDYIAVFDDARNPLGLGSLVLRPGWFVEDIFDAVKESKDFEELFDRLGMILPHIETEILAKKQITLSVYTHTGTAHLRVRVL